MIYFDYQRFSLKYIVDNMFCCLKLHKNMMTKIMKGYNWNKCQMIIISISIDKMYLDI